MSVSSDHLTMTLKCMALDIYMKQARQKEQILVIDRLAVLFSIFLHVKM